MTLRLQIANALLAALNAGSPPATTEKSRGFEVPPGDTYSMTLRFSHEVIDAPVDPKGGSHRRSPVRLRAMVYLLEARARATSGATAEENCETLLGWATSKVGGSRLGGLVWSVEEKQIRWEQVQGDTKYCKATLALAAQYNALSNDATRST